MHYSSFSIITHSEHSQNAVFHWIFQSKSYAIILTVCLWDYQNNALWDNH